MKNSTRKTLAALTVPAALCFAGTAFGAGPLALCDSGQPFLWADGGSNIPFNPDQGNLGPLDNAQAIAQVQASFDAWTGVATSTVSYSNAGTLPVDVNFDNFIPFVDPLEPDGLSAIVFDDTGEIFDFLFGPGSGVLGFAGPEWGDTLACEITEGVSFLNGPAFDDLTAATDVMVHEFGHYTNLAHTIVNGQLFVGLGDATGPNPDNPFSPPDPFAEDYLETMYPFYFGPGIGTQTLERDDIASVSALYPDASFAATTANISGTILATNGETRLTGVTVIARNEADPFEDAVSAFSGDYNQGIGGQADPVTGTYTLFGLTPGANYRVYVNSVLTDPASFSTPVLVPLPGPEEYYNGPGESNNVDTADPPLEFAFVNPPASGVDVTFNSPRPGDPLPLGDDNDFELFLPFDYDICGMTFDSVFVNANGSLTFGAPDSFFGNWVEDVGLFLSETPRIAPLWDDLSPNAGGFVTFGATEHRFSVTWQGVPEFPDDGANTFTVELKPRANVIDITYGELSAADGLTGVSCGGAMTSGFEQSRDLNATGKVIRLNRAPAAFELFDASNPVDLAGESLRFTGTANLDDSWAEPNDSIANARNVSLPFDSLSVDRFTEIDPAGGDVDFYRFDAVGGTSLVASVGRGQLDSLIGLFDQDGNLVAIDDDGGRGLLSQIVYEVPSDGVYYLAVTTFPDSGFTGAGGSGGRYVLGIAAFDGTVLPMSDDGAVEVALPFSFPFQGASYDSVFVNGNGNLTFGTADTVSTNFIESVDKLLNGPPRIAALWDDLSPNVGGLVVAQSGATSFSVTFLDVPQFATGDSNTFAVILRADGTINISYPRQVDSPDNIVGITPGNGAVDPGPSDLSSSSTWPASGTTYELFDASAPNDLNGTTITFRP